MANAIKWEAAWVDRGSVLSTELDALADGASSAAGAEYGSQTNLDQVGVLELNVDFVAAPDAGGYVSVYMLQALDGTTYEDGSASVLPSAAALVATIDVLASTAAQKRRSGLITLLPGKTKFLLVNTTGEAFPSSGSTLKLFTTNDEIQ
jgi:hypothetical protein